MGIKFLYCSKEESLKKIIVSVTNDISTDQRVEKVCNTLYNNGYEVLLIGRKNINSRPINRKYRIKRINTLFKKSFFFYLEFNLKLLFKLLFSKKNILLSNDLDTLPANYMVSIIQRKKLVYDSHELFPEIPELVDRPFVKNFWTGLEKIMLPKLKNTYTVCNSIANYYNNKYLTNFKTIKNLPIKKEVEVHQFPFDSKNKKIILYQGAINIGRGLELIINTMSYLDNCLLVIIGNGDIYDKLKKDVVVKNLNHKIYFLGKKSPIDLRKLTPLADLGISIEEDLGLNYRFALPNKIFDYVQAEIPVLVSDLPEMKKVIVEHKVGEIVAHRIPQKLAIQINSIFEKDYSKALKKAKDKLIWENQEKELLSIFQNAQ